MRRIDGSFPAWLEQPKYLHHVPGEPKEPRNPQQKMSKARDFFRGFGIPMTLDGFIDTQRLQTEHIDRLQKWGKVVDGEGGVDMPTEDEFYKKTLLAVSLWPQKDGDTINYLIGKGAGAEAALRGNVKGRTKRPFIFPYRQHSDFELYDVKYNAGPSGENLDNTRVYPEAFVEVFGGQEYFPPTKTKGLRNLPFDESEKILDQTYETVDLGGVPVFIPQLELLFLDKYFAQESTPRAVNGEIMTDAELLARQFPLDKVLVHAYLEEYVIKPGITDMTPIDTIINDLHRRIASSMRRLQHMAKREQVRLTDYAVNHTYNAILNKDWNMGKVYPDIPPPTISTTQLDLEGNILDNSLNDTVTSWAEKVQKTRQERLQAKHKEIDTLFDKIDNDYRGIDATTPPERAAFVVDTRRFRPHIASVVQNVLPEFSWLTDQCEDVLRTIDEGSIQKGALQALTKRIDAYFAGELDTKPIDLDKSAHRGADAFDKWMSDNRLKAFRDQLAEAGFAPKIEQE